MVNERTFRSLSRCSGRSSYLHLSRFALTFLDFRLPFQPGLSALISTQRRWSFSISLNPVARCCQHLQNQAQLKARSVLVPDKRCMSFGFLTWKSTSLAEARLLGNQAVKTPDSWATESRIEGRSKWVSSRHLSR